MTVRQHLIKFLDYHLTHKLIFKTHDLQDLSSRGLLKFGKRLGSPETYTRQFRDLKKEIFTIDKLKSKGNEAAWLVRSKND